MEKLKRMVNDFSKITEYYFWKNFYTCLNSQNVSTYETKINEILKKYSINSHNELVKLIEDSFQISTLETDSDFCKDILFLINTQNRNNKIDYDDTIFKKIYTSIIDNNLYNPNWNIGVSNEPFFTLLPIVPELFDINMKVYKSSLIDWQLLDNGSDSFMGFVNRYVEASDNNLKNYYLDVIKNALNTNCDIYSTLRYKSSSRKVCFQMESIRSLILKMDDSKIGPIKELLLNAEQEKLKFETAKVNTEEEER